MEFPHVSLQRVGKPHRYGYGIEGVINAIGRDTPATTLANYTASALAKYDLHTGTVERSTFAPGQIPSEGAFVPAQDATGEDDGWIMTYLYDATTDTSELAILDATNIAHPPIARIALPQRIPYGFHGNWIPDES